MATDNFDYKIKNYKGLKLFSALSLAMPIAFGAKEAVKSNPVKASTITKVADKKSKATTYHVAKVDGVLAQKILQNGYPAKSAKELGATNSKAAAKATDTALMSAEQNRFYVKDKIAQLILKNAIAHNGLANVKVSEVGTLGQMNTMSASKAAKLNLLIAYRANNGLAVTADPTKFKLNSYISPNPNTLLQTTGFR